MTCPTQFPVTPKSESVLSLDISHPKMKDMHVQSEHRPSETSAVALSLEPRNNDVLCGRGQQLDEHPGNIHFRQIVNKHKTKYLNTERKGKKDVALALIKQLEQMAPPARFLVRDKVDKDTIHWIEADQQTAYNKTMQTLRQMPKQKRKKISSTPPQNNLSVTTQGSQQKHQELYQHPGLGLQEAISSGRNYPYIHIASASKTDNPIHPEKQHCSNMIRSKQGLLPFTDGRQSLCFQQQPVNPCSITAYFRSTLKNIDACKNMNRKSISTTSEDKPVPVADHPEELQETMSTEDSTSTTFTSDEAEYASKVFLEELPPCFPKKRQRIIHAERTTHVQKC